MASTDPIKTDSSSRSESESESEKQQGKPKSIWSDAKLLTDANVQAAEQELAEYAELEQKKSLWAPEDARVNRWILRTDEDATLERLLASLGLPPEIPVREVDCSGWGSFADVAAAMRQVFGDAWMREDLADDEAQQLFWSPPFVVLRNMGKIAAAAFSPFMTLYWSARIIYEQSLGDEEPIAASALIILSYPYSHQSYDFGDDDKGVAMIPTVEIK